MPKDHRVTYTYEAPLFGTPREVTLRNLEKWQALDLETLLQESPRVKSVAVHAPK